MKRKLVKLAIIIIVFTIGNMVIEHLCGIKVDVFHKFAVQLWAMAYGIAIWEVA